MITFEIPASEMAAFEAEIKRYYQATGKDAEYVVNRTALNVAIKAAQNTPTADAAQIRALAKKPWWPKKVAKTIMGGGMKLRGKRPKRYGGRAHVKGNYTREEARQVSKQMIRNRVRRRGYIRSGWSPAIARLSALKLSLRGKATGTPAFTRSSPGKAPGDVRPAEAGLAPVCEIINRAQGALPVASPGLRAAIPLATQDMKTYIDEKFGATAKQFSAT